MNLNAPDTHVVKIPKLRDAKKPDFRGNTLLANATDGSVLWIRLDDVPVMGRLVVMQRHKGMASNYDCGGTCPSRRIDLSPCAIVPAGRSQLRFQ